MPRSVSNLSLEFCDPCKEEDDRSDRKATCFCVNCEEYLCVDCEISHRKIRSSRDHTIYKNLCDPCRFEDKNKHVSGDWYCKDCKEFLCSECQTLHKKNKTSRKHKSIRVDSGIGPQTKVPYQDSASKRNDDEQAEPKNAKAPPSKSSEQTTPEETFAAVNPLSDCTSFDASVPGDKLVPNITGSTFLPDGRLMLADSMNKKLKLFDKDFNFVSHCKCEYPHFDVAVIDENHVFATSFGRDMTVFQVKEQLEHKSTVSVEHNGKWGISSIGRNKFVVTEPICKTLYVISDAGTIYSSINKDSNGKTLFSFPSYVSTDTKKSRVYVSDHENNCVCALRLDEGFALGFTYKHDKLKGPHGIAVDHEDDVYVCGCHSNNIHQLSKDGEHKQILLSDQIMQPQTIAFSPSGRKFIVGCVDKKIVKVFTVG